MLYSGKFIFHRIWVSNSETTYVYTRIEQMSNILCFDNEIQASLQIKKRWEG